LRKCCHDRFLGGTCKNKVVCECTNNVRLIDCGYDQSFLGIRCPFDESACSNKCCIDGYNGGNCGGFLGTKCKCNWNWLITN
jgi:hypothetical protein